MNVERNYNLLKFRFSKRVNFINKPILFLFMNQTPKSLGFRMPAEWEAQEAVWLA